MSFRRPLIVLVAAQVHEFRPIHAGEVPASDAPPASVPPAG
jgi:hypothetical protein